MIHTCLKCKNSWPCLLMVCKKPKEIICGKCYGRAKEKGENL